MKILLRVVFVIFICGIISCKKESNRNHIALKDFFRTAERSQLQISPNGEQVAYLQMYNGHLNLFVQKIDSNVITRLTSDSNNNIKTFFWANDNKLLFLKDQSGDEYYHLYSIDISGSAAMDLTPFEKIKIRFVDQDPIINNELLITLNKRTETLFDLYRLNIANGDLKMIAQNPGNISTWKADHKGQIRLAIETDGVNESILFREDESKPFVKVITLNFKETLSPICFTADNQNIFAVSNLNRDKMSIVEFNLKSAKETKVVFSHPDVDVQNMDYSFKSNGPFFCNYITSKWETNYFSEQAKDLKKQIIKQLGDDNFLIVSYSRDENRFLLKTYSDRSLGIYYLFDYSENKLIKISDASPWIDENKMASMKPISFYSRDGLLIHGFLTLPLNSSGKSLPLVVNPHGGPFIRNRWGFNPETQFLANRGYAVLQVNYRGSNGYGKKFMQAGYKEVGRKMQDDITDGVKWLIQKGVVDSTKIGIFGFSFGGYFALNGIIRDSALYQCAVSYCGLTNLFSFIKEVPPQYVQFLEMTYEMFGNPEKDADYLKEYSPAFHIENIKVPILIAQGKKDPRVDEEEISVFVKQLKKNNIPVKYVMMENEGHGFQNENNRFLLYSEVEKFLEENLMK